MKISRTSTVVISLIFAKLICGGPGFLCGPGVLYASAGTKTFVPKIVRVGQDSVTVQAGRNGGMHIEGHAPVNIVTYKITSFTDIEVNGLKGGIADLAPGMDVRVVIGMDPDEAESIVATSEGPALPDASPSPAKKVTSSSTTNPGMTFMKPFQKITRDVVVGVSDSRITIAPMGGKAIAYEITPSTLVYVNGAKSDIGQISVGMNVTVAASGESTAGTIDARDADDTEKAAK